MVQKDRKSEKTSSKPPVDQKQAEVHDDVAPDGEENHLQGVFVQVRYNDIGECQIVGCLVQGSTRPSEVSDILSMGGKAHRASMGL